MSFGKTRAFLFAAVFPVLHAGTIVVPGADAASVGSIGNDDPFDLADTNLSSMRYQQVYASSQFSGPILITGMDFRVAALFSGFSSTLSSIQIDLSTTSAAVDHLDETFSNNVGSDDTVVFAKGALALSGSAGGPAGVAKAFDVHIGFSTPFIYDPAKGNLLLDVRNFDGGSSGPLDSDQSNTDSVSRLVADGVNETKGLTDSSGLVTQFDFDTVATPEPSSIAFGALGLLAIAAVRRATR
jgi:hypothetical protein